MGDDTTQRRRFWIALGSSLAAAGTSAYSVYKTKRLDDMVKYEHTVVSVSAKATPMDERASLIAGSRCVAERLHDEGMLAAVLGAAGPWTGDQCDDSCDRLKDGSKQTCQSACDCIDVWADPRRDVCTPTGTDILVRDHPGCINYKRAAVGGGRAAMSR
jgi:hypothetical protein